MSRPVAASDDCGESHARTARKSAPVSAAIASTGSRRRRNTASATPQSTCSAAQRRASSRTAPSVASRPNSAAARRTEARSGSPVPPRPRHRRPAPPRHGRARRGRRRGGRLVPRARRPRRRACGLRDRLVVVLVPLFLVAEQAGGRRSAPSTVRRYFSLPRRDFPAVAQRGVSGSPARRLRGVRDARCRVETSPPAASVSSAGFGSLPPASVADVAA